LQVRALDPAILKFDATIFRVGPNGLTNVGQLNNLTPTVAADPVPNATTGVAEPNWPAAATVTTAANWTSGIYQINLTTTPGNGPATPGFVTFVVRDDASTSKILYVLPTASWQASNEWGGKSLNDFSSSGSAVGALSASEPSSKRAFEVSYNRPYC